MRLRRLSRRATVVSVLLGGALLAAGIAWASIPDSSGVIHGCILTRQNNVLKVIDTDLGQTCPAGSQGLNWNQTGPQGPAGPQGLQGPQGAQGPAGPGATYHRETYSTTVPSIAQDFGLNMQCSYGTAVSGGGDISPLEAGVINVDEPTPGVSSGWSIRFTQNGADPFWPGATINGWVVCAS